MADTDAATNFANTPLMQWFQLLLNRETLEVEDLVDGVALSEIMIQIDPRPINAKADKHARGNVNLMIQNLNILLKHIKAFYEDIQGQVIVMSLPNILTLAQEPTTEAGIAELQKLLLLIVGCAIQCDDREHYIEKMKQLTYQGMEIMMNHIKDITENTDNVLNFQWMDQDEQLPPAELDDFLRNVTFHVKKLVAERDNFGMMITGLTQERDYLQSQQGSPNSSLSRKESFASPATKQHLSVELAEVKAKLRKMKQELDDKTEQANDLKNELEEKDNLLKRLKQESLELANDARAARTYRDENDILKEKATKATRLEHEVERLKEKLKDVDFYKQRVEELRDDNRVLHETKAMLDEQLETAQSRLDELVDTEKKIIDLKRQISSLMEEKDKDHQRIQELIEENMGLEMDKKQSMNESGNLAYQLEQAKTSDGMHKSIHEESNESAQNRVLRLEKENRHLQSLINSYKVSMSSAQIEEANKVELEKENKRLGNKVTQLQELLNKEKHSVLDYEQLSGDMMAEKKKLETMLETVKSNSARQIEELQHENEQLNKTVETLRKRTKINAEGKTKDIEKENKVLSETVKEVTSRIHQVEFEKKQLQKSLEQAKDNIERAEELTKENTKLEKDNISLQKSIAQLKITCQQVEQLEQMNSDLDVENRQLKKQVDNLKNMTLQVQDLEKDKGLSEQEASKLRRQVESLKKTCEKMTTLEQEKLDAEKALKRMRRSMEAMKQSKEQTEKMEILQAELENELERVRNQLDVSQVSKEKEIQELEKENEELQGRLEKLVASSKKLEHYEREYQKLETDSVKLQSTNKKLSKEATRAKKSLESMSAKFEEATEELESMNRQNKAMMRQIEKGEDGQNRIRELETEVRNLKKNQSVEKKTLTTLREDLVNEKLLVQQKQSEMDRLSSELELIGLNKEQLLSANSQSDENRFKALESRFESTFKKTVEAKEEKINSLDARLQESVNINKKLKEDIKNIKRDYEALAQRHNEEVDYSKSRNRSSRDYSATTELLKIKDHLIDVERKNATLIAENSSIQTMSQELKEQVTKLRSQNESMIIKQTKLQDETTNLKTQCAKLQVENSTLQSQTTSLLAQNTSVTNQHSTIETEKHELVRQLEDAKHERDNMEKDHDDLMQLHENQTIEVEGLMQEHQKLKSQHKKIKVEFKDLENKYNSLVRTKDEVERLKRRLESEVERKNTEGQMVEGNLDVMKEAHEKLNNSYKKLSIDYEELQDKNRSEKTSHNALKLEFAKLEAELESMRDQNQELDFKTSKLSNRCDVLMQLKENLEDENRHLLEQINRLMSQNEELLSQTLESKDQIYTEQKQYTERMQEIRRQKEKLEEKIMDLYRTPGPSPPKRRGFGATLKKTFQNLGGKDKDNRRRRDGLPPTSANSSRHAASPRNPDSSLLSQGSLGSKDHSTPKSADRDNESLGSNSSENHRKQSAVDPLANDTSRSSKDVNRRSRLGGGMAYSTTALNALSTTNGGAGDAQTDSNYLKNYQSIEDMRGGIMASQSSLDHESVDSMGSEGMDYNTLLNGFQNGDVSNTLCRVPCLACASSQQLKKTISQQDSASSLSGSLQKGRNSSASSEEHHPNAPKTPTADKISLQQFLDETKTKNAAADKRAPKLPTTPPVTKPPITLPMTSMEQKSPKRSPSYTEYKSTLSRSTPLKSNRPEGGDSPSNPPASPTKRKPPRLDLSSLQITPPESGRKSGGNTGSPTSRTPGKVEENPTLTPQEKETLIFVVRSPTDSGKVQVKQQQGISPNHDQGTYRSNVTLRPRTNPQARPTSMIEKPTGSVTPYSHLTPHTASMRSSRDSPVTANRSGSVIERLDSLVSSPRGSSTPTSHNNTNQSNGVSVSPRRAQTPTSGNRPSQHANYTSMSLPRPRRSRPHGGALTSTPTSSRQVDIALVNPLQGSPGNPKRRDVPPDVVPSPIRRDVPPDTNSLRRPSKNPEPSPLSTPTGARRPPTPTKPKQEETSNDSDKSTLWFEYGCV
ncbi:girdin-like isoform X3 [Styela clava]